MPVSSRFFIIRYCVLSRITILFAALTLICGCHAEKEDPATSISPETDRQTEQQTEETSAVSDTVSTEIVYLTTTPTEEEESHSEETSEYAPEFTEEEPTAPLDHTKFTPGYISQKEEDILKNLISDYLTSEYRELDENAQLWADFDELFYEAPQHTDIWLKIVDGWDRIVQGGRNGFSESDYGADGVCFVVLGFRLNADGTMTKELIGRLEKAYELATNYPKAFILCTGGNTNGTQPEAAAMKKWLTGKGIDEGRILTEENSKNTVENVLLSFDLVGTLPQIRHLVIVTSHYHLQGAAQLFAEQSILSGAYTDIIGAVPCNSEEDTSFSAATLASWMYDLFKKQ